ncbi:arylamine N-acetyltransferase [Rummeliibacillus sp. SL167]|uniref:arylamine N-acetyltransferase n=1 Tax=Rummeliibacillus sp. SL167 TaxID=2579792 RepID=UPI0016448101|nr:arylamine N-acetyltransferase [Rummeliibacillus sp. SL167]
MTWHKEYLDLLHINYEFIENKTKFEILSKIILNHQLYIPYDTIRKFQDFKSRKELKNLYSHPEDYIVSVKKNRLGGTCLHFTWALYNLLKSLNFNVKILKLEYQHFALAVEIDLKEYYIDVGFWSPLFKPLPLRKSWEINKGDNSVEWKYSNNHGTLFWSGLPAKEWNGHFITIDELWNDWESSMTKQNYFLNNLYINKWKDEDTFMFLLNNKYTEFYKGVKITEAYIDSLESIITNINTKFNIDICEKDLLGLLNFDNKLINTIN